MSYIKNGAIDQASMGSTRLPGKVLRHILGKPMMWYLVECLKKSQFINEIIIATTAEEADNSIIALAQRCKVKSFSGSEEDVLDRFFQASKRNKLKVIVRICSDCPLLTTEVIDKVIKYYLDHKEDLDYVSNFLKPSYPLGLGVEVFSTETLERCWAEAKEPYQREHVTAYIYEHPNLFRLGNVRYNRDLSHLRLTVDTKEDLRFVREVYLRLYKDGRHFSMGDILNLFKKEPKLLKINSHIKQKGLRD